MNALYKALLGIGTAFATLVVLAAPAAGAAPPARPELATSDDYVPGEILVRFVEGASARSVEGIRQALGANEVREIEGIRVRHWRFGNGLSVEKALEIVSKHAERRHVEFAEPNWIFHADLVPDDPLRGELWGLHNVGQAGGARDADIDAPEAWGQTTDCSAVVVAIVDTGVDFTHPDLQGNLDTDNGWDFVNGDADPTDDNGHGTHVAGTIGAVGGNGIGVAGVCWKVMLLPLKGLNASGSGDSAGLASAIRYAGQHGASVISASWGSDKRSSTIDSAITASGALFVAAAGNDGSTTKHYPAGSGLANVVSVAATDRNDALAAFSNRGSSWVHLGAPGVDVLSTYPGGGYRLASGTSMATPHVSGVAALVKAGHPAYSTSQVRSALLGSIDPIPSLAGLTVTGGRLNAARAVGVAPAPPSDTTPPDAVAGLAPGVVTTTSVALGWVAPADAGVGSSGRAYLYDLRYATLPVTEAMWASAKPAAAEPLPGEVGFSESLTISGLVPSTTYYFALKAFDWAGNVSGLSNLASVSTVPGPHWELSVVPETTDVYHALAWDPLSGNPAIAVAASDGFAKLARWNGEDWTTETVGAGGSGVDLEFDPGDRNPSLSWGSGSLVFAHFTGTAWKLETIESRNAPNDVTSLAYAPDKSPAIAYRNTSGKGSTRFAKKSNGSWTIQVVDAAVAGRYISLAFDRAGMPAVAYCFDSNNDGLIDGLKLARWNGSAWKTEVVESGVAGWGVFVSLAFDASGNPALAHGNDTIRYLGWNGSAWIAETVGSGYAPSLAFAATGPVLSYRAPSSEIRFARRADGTWTSELVEAVSNAWTTHLVLDPQGFPSFSYRRSPSTGNTTGLARWVPE